MAMTVKIGKPKYEQGSRNYFAFKKNQNSFVLRVLPPMGDLADSGKWSIYHRVEFGYKTTDGKLKPFLSPRVVNYNGMVEQESETHKRREQIKSQLEQAKKSGNSELVEQCNQMLMKYNQDAKHYMNVVDLQGNVGLFKLGHRGFQALKAEIDRLRSEGVDPIGVENGRFFVFSRSGKGRDTLYTVVEYKQKQEVTNNDGSKMVVDASYPHAITDSIMAKLETDAFELDKVYPTVTPEEEYRIVHEGPSAVDQILGSKGKGNAASKESSAQPQAQAQPEQQATQQPVEKAETPVEQPQAQPEPQAQEPVQTQEPVQAKEEIPVQEEAPSTQTQPPSDVAGMSDEDFFKKIESGQF